MYKALLICAVVSASAVGCSTTPAHPDGQTPSTAARVGPCSQDTTGSRIPRPVGQCSPSPVRTYSQADIDRTGQTDTGDALQQLDPSITVHH
jgi:hypothetical protein